MVMASHWVGFTFPGIMELPGSFSGKESSPRPHLGPEPRNRMSLAILKERINCPTPAIIDPEIVNLFIDPIN